MWKKDFDKFMDNFHPNSDEEYYEGIIEYLKTNLDKQEINIEKMKCCSNCKYSEDRMYIFHGCDGNCVEINGKQTWTDWVLK